MNAPRPRAAAVAALLCVASCQDPAGVSFADLVGNWRAVRYEATDEDESEDWIATGRMTGLTIAVSTDGVAVVSVQLVNRVEPIVITGQVSQAGEAVTFHVGGGELTGTLVLDRDVLAVTMPEFVLDDEVYALVMTLKRLTGGD